MTEVMALQVASEVAVKFKKNYNFFYTRTVKEYEDYFLWRFDVKELRSITIRERRKGRFWACMI